MHAENLLKICAARGRRRSFAVLAAACAALSWSASVGPAAAAVTAEQQALVDAIMPRLLAIVERPEGYDAWPPTWKIIDDKGIGAFSSLDAQQKPKKVPIIRIHRGFLEEVAQMNEHRAAFVLGHELAHLLEGHLLNWRGDTGLTAVAFGREDEIAADKLGMELALKAGFSFRPALGAPRRFIELGHEYTSFEGVGSDHPSWTDRIALLESDDVQAQLWRATSAFSTGVFLLQAEQHAHAAACFERVVRDFPKCYEALANLGYARLMMYCDALEPEDLRAFNVGHLIVGGFYQRAGSLAEGIRGIQEELWFKAVDDLQKALALREDLILARANLALAYLVHPSGTSNVGAAAEQFEQVSQLLKNESIAGQIDSLTHASLLANSWIGVAHNDPARSAAVMQQIENFLRRAEQDGSSRGAAQSLRSALDYTRAATMAAASAEGDRRGALPLFERYLAATSPTSSWWPLAYERYVATAQTLGAPAKSRDELVKANAAKWRPVTSIATADGATIGLGDPAGDALARLGRADAATPVVDGGALKMYSFAAKGLTVLAGQEVAAIVLNGDNAPRIQLRRPGLGAQPAELYVGMPRNELEALLGDGWSSTSTAILDQKTLHNFYEAAGVAVKFKENKVAELIITVPPRANDSK